MEIEYDVEASITLLQECETTDKIMELLAEGETAIASYKTIRDVACITDKRLILCDKQRITGMRKSIYSIPYRSIDVWKFVTAGPTDIGVQLEIWTEVSHFTINVERSCDVKYFQETVTTAIMNKY